MAKSGTGKGFEQDWSNSCPPEIFIERVRDVLYMSGSSTSKDYIVYKHPNLFLFELKSHKGKSLPIKEEYYKDEKRRGEIKNYGVITAKQLEGLYEERTRKGVYAGFIVNFREKFATYYVPVKLVYDFIKDENRERSSIPIEWFEENGIRIPQRKKITRWTYDFRFLDLIVEMGID